MNAIDQYIQNVLDNILAKPAERQRIESDLRAHLQEALAAGETPQAVLARMGTPQEVAAEFMSQVKLAYAGFWLRLLAFLIDLLVIFIGVGILALAALFLTNRVPTHPAGLDYLLGATVILVVAGCALGAAGIIVLYFPLLEGRFGQTLGKRLLGLRVLKDNGLPIGYKEAFLRRLSYYFDIFPFDAVFIPFSEKKQRAFDIIARTIVIKS